LTKESLKGLKIAIVGGTNGIGRSLAREFLLKGAKVIVAGRNFIDQDTQINFI
jgi:short-subunit dehydrogenase involved in D-alanine esterification of teichoic acids